MPKPWKEIIAKPEYAAMDPHERGRFQRYYFEQSVAPQISDPAERDGAWNDFLSRYPLPAGDDLPGAPPEAATPPVAGGGAPFPVPEGMGTPERAGLVDISDSELADTMSVPERAAIAGIAGKHDVSDVNEALDISLEALGSTDHHGLDKQTKLQMLRVLTSPETAAPDQTLSQGEPQHGLGRRVAAQVASGTIGVKNAPAVREFIEATPEVEGIGGHVASGVGAIADPLSLAAFSAGGGLATRGAGALVKGRFGAAADKLITAMAASAGGFGMFGAAAEGGRQVDEGEFDPGALAKAAGKESLVGAMVGPATLLANPVIRYLTESAIFGTAGPALEGRMPTEDDYAGAFALIGALHASRVIPKVARDALAKDPAQRTPKEAAALEAVPEAKWAEALRDARLSRESMEQARQLANRMAIEKDYAARADRPQRDPGLSVINRAEREGRDSYRVQEMDGRSRAVPETPEATRDLLALVPDDVLSREVARENQPDSRRRMLEEEARRRQEGPEPIETGEISPALGRKAQKRRARLERAGERRRAVFAENLQPGDRVRLPNGEAHVVQVAENGAKVVTESGETSIIRTGERATLLGERKSEPLFTRSQPDPAAERPLESARDLSQHEEIVDLVPERRSILPSKRAAQNPTTPKESPAVRPEAPRAGKEATEDYRGIHRAPGREDGAPMSEMNKMYPDDIYGPDGARYYGGGGGAAEVRRAQAVVDILRAVRGKPDAEVTVYRGLPKGAGDRINPGDWVTTDRRYAEEHAQRYGEADVIEMKVRAGDLFTEANSLYEFGYDPAPKRGLLSKRPAEEPAGRIGRKDSAQPTKEPSGEAGFLDLGMIGFNPEKRAVGEGPFELPPETPVRYFQRRVQDRFNRLNTVQREAERVKGKPVPESQDAYLHAELFPGRTAERIDKFRESTYSERSKDNLLASAQRDGFSLDDIGEYLHAKHAAERNKHVASVNDKLPDGGSGMTTAEAAKILKKHEGTGIEKHAAEWRRVADETLDMLLEEGLIDVETHKSLSKQYTDYVPLQREGFEDGGSPRSQGFSVTGKDIKRARGSERKVLNPVVSIIAARESAIMRAEKARVGRSFLELAEANPDGPWKIESLQYRPRYDANGEIQWMDPQYKFADNVLEVRVDGKSKLITIDDPALAKSLKNLGLERGVKYLQAFNSFLRYVVTTGNPKFMVTNFERDLQTALVHLGGEAPKGVARKATKDLPAAMRGIYENVRTGEGGEWAQRYQELKDLGGKVGWYDHKTLAEKADQVRKEVGRASQANRGQARARRAARVTGDYVNALNEVVESGIRLSAYKNLVDAGMSKPKAAQAAKNLTVNFNKKGELGALMNSLYLFSNAGVQGGVRIGQSVAKSKKTRAIVAGIVAAGFAESWLNDNLAGDEYEKLREYEKDSHWNLMLPDGGRLVVRVPYGYNVFKAMGGITADRLRGDITDGEAMKRFVMAVEAGFNPISAGSIAQFIAPTIVDAPVQVAENKNFFGGPIMPEQPQFSAKIPDSQRHFKSVRPFSKGMTDYMNEATGGSDRVSGWVDISPETLDHYIDFAGGGIGRLAGDFIATGEYLAKGEKPDANNIPFLDLFYKPSSDYAEVSVIHDMRKESARTLFNAAQVDKYYRYIEDALEKGKITAKQAAKYRKEFDKNQAAARGEETGPRTRSARARRPRRERRTRR